MNIDTSTAEDTLAALLALAGSEVTPRMRSKPKRPRQRAYDPCQRCGKPTRDALCYGCQQRAAENPST